MKETPKCRKSTDFINGISSILPSVFADRHTELSGKSPFELWKIFFTEDLMKTIVVQTNLYANRGKNEDHFCFEKEELLNFLVVLSLSGYHSLPGEQHHWSNQPDMGVSIVSKVLSRKCFLSIKSKIHFMDNNTLGGSNKMAKIEPLCSTLSPSYVWNISMEYFMIGFQLTNQWSHTMDGKIFIRGKPKGFGSKLWVSVDLMDILMSSIFTRKV